MVMRNAFVVELPREVPGSTLDGGRRPQAPWWAATRGTMMATRVN